MNEAAELIRRLDLQAHPEGGWYKETWRAEAADGERGGATAILFLLDRGERSHWHKVDAAEIWLWHAGSPLTLRTAEQDAGPISEVTLGPDVLAGEMPQQVIGADHWQAADAHRGWALVSCIVSPAFRFEGFTLAAPDWSPGGS